MLLSAMLIESATRAIHQITEQAKKRQGAESPDTHDLLLVQASTCLSNSK